MLVDIMDQRIVGFELFSKHPGKDQQIIADRRINIVERVFYGGHDPILARTGLSRSTIYKYIAEGVFPRSISLGYRSVGWVESEVNDWILARIEFKRLA